MGWEQPRLACSFVRWFEHSYDRLQSLAKVPYGGFVLRFGAPRTKAEAAGTCRAHAAGHRTAAVCVLGATVDPNHVLQIELTELVGNTGYGHQSINALYAERRCARLEPGIQRVDKLPLWNHTDTSITATDMSADAVDEIRFGIVIRACGDRE